MKTCKTCSKKKPSSDFYKHRLECKSCYAKRVRFDTSVDYIRELPEKKLQDGVYIVTSVLPNTRVDRAALNALKKLAKHLNTVFISLGMKPHQKPLKDEKLYYPNNISRLERMLITEKGDRIGDFRVNPQMLNPLTSIDRLPGNIIVASPKLALKTIVNGLEGARTLAATGTISISNYRSTERVGLLAEQAHSYGAIVVTINKGSIVKVEPVEIKNGRLLFRGIIFGKKANTDDSCIVFGDLHLPVDGNKLEEVQTYVLSLIKKYNPETIVFHDALSFESVSHHNSSKYFTRPQHSVQYEISNFWNFINTIRLYTNVRHIMIVNSNHEQHLWKYIQDGRFLKDTGNIDICLSILEFREYNNPVMQYICYKTDCILTKPDTEYSSVLIGIHGDSADYATRGSIDKFAKSGFTKPVIIGHSHRPGISSNVWSVGTCLERQGYEGALHSGKQGSVLIKDGLRCFI